MTKMTGIPAVLTAAGNDGGAEVVVYRNGEITLVQVKHSRSGVHVDTGAIGDLVGASNTYNVALRHSVRMTVVTNTDWRWMPNLNAAASAST